MKTVFECSSDCDFIQLRDYLNRLFPLASSIRVFPPDTDLDRLNLTVRSANCLKAMGHRTISDVMSAGRASLSGFPNFGNKSISEVVEIFALAGYQLV